MRINYSATVALDWANDRATVTVRGQRYHEPIEGADRAYLSSLVRRAVFHLFTVDGMRLDVTPARDRGRFDVVAVSA